nr:uncharacterized protein LOC117218299 isoform X2 [Megalopta genalis]XP_033322479.1 uncharacterized protein LOC117218299 isoform X2 [Megalopta genalis]
MKKYSAGTDARSKSFISTLPERSNIFHRKLICSPDSDSINGTSRKELKETLPMQNCVYDEINNSTLRDCYNYQFPYYRSSKYSTQCSDTVLVKDVGVSCMLFYPDNPEEPVSETKTYLVKQLKREYNDLSDITNKITAYTKDILNHLSKKHQRKRSLFHNLVSSKHAIGSQYINSKGKLCLKLRLLSNTETQFSTHQIAKGSNGTACDDRNVKRESNNEYWKKQIVGNTKHEKEVQTLFIGEKTGTSTSSFSSKKSSSIYNYLTTRKRRSSNQMLKSTLINSYKDKNCKERLKTSKPVVFTNWKEISKSKRSKNNAPPVSNKSHEMIEMKETSSQTQSLNSKINNLLKTRFHTINIRIIKRTKKQV